MGKQKKELVRITWQLLLEDLFEESESDKENTNEHSEPTFKLIQLFTQEDDEKSEDDDRSLSSESKSD